MSDEVVVKVSQGRLRGRKAATISGGPCFSFTAVPYARPPVGPLRFKPPQSPNPWIGVRDALNSSPVCTQIDPLTEQIIGKEDCLYLNVFSSNLPLNGTNELKPVMVWIHGGGFTMGSGNADLYGTDYFVDADIVAVTINYRVGALGFLSLDNEEVSGNMGLKDQVAALKWVKENIANFGGDPNNVTIFGESAGGASVHYLMLSPLSEGLFHKAIAQSGSALNPWAFSLTNTARAFALGETLGCKTSDPNVLLRFLSSEDAKKLVNASARLIPHTENISRIKFPFVPTVEPKTSGSFLSEHPLHLLRAGRFHKVPFITGVTSHEGIIALRGIEDKHWDKINTRFDSQLPEKITKTGSSIPLLTLAQNIRHYYFNNQAISKDKISEFIDFQTDLNFMEGVFTTLKYSVLFSSAPVYFYKFSFDGELGFVKQFSGNTDIKGACHGDDLGYLFRVGLLDTHVENSSPEMKTINRMISLWTNFAKSGNPTPAINNNIPVLWEPCTIKNLHYLYINKDLTMEKISEANRMKFWDEVYYSKL